MLTFKLHCCVFSIIGNVLTGTLGPRLDLLYHDSPSTVDNVATIHIGCIVGGFIQVVPLTKEYDVSLSHHDMEIESSSRALVIAVSNSKLKS